MAKLKQILGQYFQGKMDRRTAAAGRADGTITISGREGFIYARLGGNDSDLISVFNDVIPTASVFADMKIIVGRDPAQPDIWKVLDIQRDTVGGRTITSTALDGTPTTVTANSIPTSGVTAPGAGHAGRIPFFTPSASLSEKDTIVYNSTTNQFILGATTSPSGATNNDGITIVGESAAQGANISLVRYGLNAFISFYRANGTRAAATQALLNDVLGRISAFGYNSSAAWDTGSRARIDFVADEDRTGSAQGTRIDFSITPKESVTIATGRVGIQSDGAMFSPAMMSKQTIAAGQKLTIPADYSWVVACQITNNGDLVNSGDIVLVG